MPTARLGVVTLTLSALLLAAAGPVAFGQATAPEAKQKDREKSKPKAKSKARRDPPGYYMGRRVADVMSYLGADWLVRASREQEEHPEQMLDALKIPKGATVADVGAGVGYNSLRMARRVGDGGT